MSSPEPDDTPLRRNGGYGGRSPGLIARANGKEQLAGACVLCPASGCSLRHGSIGQGDDAYNDCEQQRRDTHAGALNQVFESLSLAHSIFAAQATWRPASEPTAHRATSIISERAASAEGCIV
jgi:hypothetical protein